MSLGAGSCGPGAEYYFEEPCQRLYNLPPSGYEECLVDVEVLADWSKCALMPGAQRLFKGPRERCGISEGDWTLEFGPGMN